MCRMETFGGRRHEMHAAKDNPLRVSALGFESKTEGITDEVSHILHFWHLIIVRQDDGMLLNSEGSDLCSSGFHHTSPPQCALPYRALRAQFWRERCARPLS